MTLNKVFELFGRSVRVHSFDDSWYGESYFAVIQPLRYKNKMYLEDKRVPIGIGDMSYYLYLGPAQHDLTVLDTDEYLLKAGEESFIITRAEKIYVGSKVTHIWAVLKKTREEE